MTEFELQTAIRGDLDTVRDIWYRWHGYYGNDPEWHKASSELTDWMGKHGIEDFYFFQDISHKILGKFRENFLWSGT